MSDIYRAVQPPSIISVVPVIIAAASDAKKTADEADIRRLTDVTKRDR